MVGSDVGHPARIGRPSWMRVGGGYDTRDGTIGFRALARMVHGRRRWERVAYRTHSVRVATAQRSRVRDTETIAMFGWNDPGGGQPVIPLPRRRDDRAEEETAILSRLEHVTTTLNRPATNVRRVRDGRQAELIDERDDRSVALLPCSEDAATLSIGRGHLAAIRVPDAFVHRLHAHIRWDSARNVHVLEDAGGANGTYVNGVRVHAPRRLSDEDRIRIGATRLRYRLPAVR